MFALVRDLFKVNWPLGAAWIGVDQVALSLADVDHLMKALLSAVAIILSILTYIDNRRRIKRKYEQDSDVSDKPSG